MMDDEQPTDKSIADGLYAIAEALSEVANAISEVGMRIKYLGNGDAPTTLGAIENLSLVIKEGMERIQYEGQRKSR